MKSSMIEATSSSNHAKMEVPCSGRVILRHIKDPSFLLGRCRLDPNPPNIGQFAVPVVIVKHD